jgi:hypothetical protein
MHCIAVFPGYLIDDVLSGDWRKLARHFVLVEYQDNMLYYKSL